MSGLVFLALLLFLSTLEQSEPSSSAPPSPEKKKAETTPAPWPQAVPSGLPPFPGSGWEPDEPPPAAVSTRAYQLLNQLWQSGSGTFKTEKVGERWITFRAETVRSGKRGVVAYRVRSGASVPSSGPPPSTYTVPIPSPEASPPWGVPAEYRTPGALPQAASPSSSPIFTSSAPTGTPSAAQVRTLRLTSPMMSGADVSLAQQHLHISADGKFGPATKAAVIAFQKSHALVPDGIVGPATWKPLLQA